MPQSADLLLPLILARRERQASARAASEAAAKEQAERARAVYESSTSDKRAHAAWRAAEATALSEALAAHVERLRTMLEVPPSIDSVDFESLKDRPVVPPFDAQGLDVPAAPPELHLPPEPSGLVTKIFSGAKAKHDAAVEVAKAEHERAMREHAGRERDREERFAHLRADHDRLVAAAERSVEAQHREVDAFRASLEQGAPNALTQWFAALLASSDLPDGFPRRATLAIDPDRRLLVVDYELPGLEVVPAAESVRYEASADRIEEIPRPSARRKDLYALVVASTALRITRDLFAADRTRSIGEIALNGYVHGVDRATGETVRPYLVSLRVTREEFDLADVTHTDPIVSVRTLDAAFSTNPAELAPVRQLTGVHSVGVKHMASTPDI